VLSYSAASRVVLIEFTLQETFQTEAALLAWSTGYPQDELPAHINQILHYVRNPSTRGLLRPLSGPRTGVMLFRRVQGGKDSKLSESLSSGTTTPGIYCPEGQRSSSLEEKQSTSDNSKQLHPRGKLQSSATEKAGEPEANSGEVGVHRSDSTSRSKGLSRSPCNSNACYHTTTSGAFSNLFGLGSDQSHIGVVDKGKQQRSKPSIISKEKKRQRLDEPRESSIDRFDRPAGADDLRPNKCIHCGREFVAPSNYRYCPMCYVLYRDNKQTLY